MKSPSAPQVDFQITHVGNPLIDVLYFLFSSLRAPILVQEFDHLLKFYYDQFVEACQSLGVSEKAPSAEQFAEQFKNSAYFAALTLPEIVPIVVMERHADANVEAFLGDPESEAAKNLSEKMYWNPKYKEILEKVIPFLYERGYLNPQSKTTEAEAVADVKPVIVEETPKVTAEVVAEIVVAPTAAVEGEKVEHEVSVCFEEGVHVPAVTKEAEVVEEVPTTTIVQEAEVEAPTVTLADPVEVPEVSAPISVAPSTEEVEPVVPVASAAVVVEEEEKKVHTPPTTPTVSVEPWPSSQQEVKPKRLMKARIEETINKFAALEANGDNKFK